MEFVDAGVVCAAHTAWTSAKMQTTLVPNAAHMLAHTKTKQTNTQTINIPVDIPALKYL